MLNGWLHVIRGGPCLREYGTNYYMEIDVVEGSIDGVPSMFYMDEHTAVQGPSEIPATWELIVAS